MSKELEYARAGDYVAEHNRWHGMSIRKIDRVTATQIVVGSEKWRKDSGRLIGEISSWNMRHINLATPEDFIKLRVQQAQGRFDQLKVTAGNLELVEALIAASIEPTKAQS